MRTKSTLYVKACVLTSLIGGLTRPMQNMTTLKRAISFPHFPQFQSLRVDLTDWRFNAYMLNMTTVKCAISFPQLVDPVLAVFVAGRR